MIHPFPRKRGVASISNGGFDAPLAHDRRSEGNADLGSDGTPSEAVGQGYPQGIEAPCEARPGEGSSEAENQSHRGFNVHDLGYARACRDVDEAVAKIKSLLPEIIAEIDKSVEEKRRRITDILDRLPADCEPS